MTSSRETVSELALLRSYPELWDIICCTLPGDSICLLTDVLYFKRATTGTSAYQLLAGCDSDCNVVPWLDPVNVRSSIMTKAPGIVKFRDAMSSYEAQRITLARIFARSSLLRIARYPVYALTRRGGPARPPSPMPDSSPAYHHYTSMPILHTCGAAVYGIEKGFTHAPSWQVLCRGTSSASTDSGRSYDDVPDVDDNDDDDDDDDEEDVDDYVANGDYVYHV